MVQPPPVPDSPPRRGIILLVVVVLLTLFAVVGLSFVLYANAAATSARLFREAEAPSRPDVAPERLLAYFLGQLLYDVSDDRTGIYSALRGHSLGRNLYGLNYVPGENEALIAAKNAAPFNGTGRLHYDSAFGQDDYFLINYTYFPADGFLRDPERHGRRPGLPAGPHLDNRGPFAGGCNAPYTYPDLNNLFLAAVKADGTVLLPSFHRPWTGFGPLAPSNPNWHKKGPQDQALKYLVLRPRPADMGPGFPVTEDAGGDVKNLLGAPGGNDSVWLDLDFPVRTAPDGRKFKPLFAPLIVDLDNRVNLNVHGNLRGRGGAAHASNSGWGPWEVNPARVLNRSPGEWTALLHGNGVQGGRYGHDRRPHSVLPADHAPAGRFQAPVDWDGSQELAGGAPSDRLRLPGTLPVLPYQCFPGTPAGYGQGSPAERAGHPRLYNPVQPTVPDRAFALSSLEGLLRYGDTGSPALTSELFRLCPRNFGDPADAAGSARRRGLVTVHSFDVDRPGITPWFWPATPAVYYRLPALASHPAGDALAFPPLVVPPGASPPWAHPDSEFGADGRTAAHLTGLRRLDLNRYLPAYPSPGPAGQITDLVGFLVAQRARQYLAMEVFERLGRLTGAGEPTALPPQPAGAAGPVAERWNALRWLAQLAVNIVDYLDADDSMTPFPWHPAGQWVYGTELPRLVLNEAYVQYDNDPADPGLAADQKAQWYNVNVWVELFNPFFADPTLSDNGAAVLQTGTDAVYQVVLSRNEPNRAPENVSGEPANVIKAVSSYGPNPALWAVQPSGGRYAGPVGGTQGFYVLGPQAPFPLQAHPNLPATLFSPDLTYRVDADLLFQKPTILLRRLACPHLRYDPNPASPAYNPYVTVDYMADVPSNDGRLFDADGPKVNPPAPALAERSSWGRKQPYAAHITQRKPQQTKPPRLDQPQNTFFQHNADPQTPGPNAGTPPPDNTYPPFDWLVHLDRPLVSPVELLHVSAYKPHELMQQFVTGDLPNQRFTHRVPWLDEDLAGTNPPQSHRLYRALEFLGTRNQTAGMMTAVTTSPEPIAAPGPDQVVRPRATAGRTTTGGSWRIEVGAALVIDRGLPSEEVVRVKTVAPLPPADPVRFTADFLKPHAAHFTITPTTISERVPGRINLNTVWDEETFQALCDPQPSNSFNADTVSAVFKRLKDARTVGGEVPGAGDRPFRSLATGLTPYDDPQLATGGIQDTLLRSAGGQLLFAVPGETHPYATTELLTKIFNNVTVRSNVFAVWLTVGFFEVTDETSRPVQLGAELGRAEGRYVRHRMFALVDRSVLAAHPGPQPRFDPRAVPSPGCAAGQVVPYFSIID
jgi:hypothetical protein